MGTWQFNPTLDEIIDDLPLSNEEIESIMELYPDCFDDIRDNPVCYQVVKNTLPLSVKVLLSSIELETELEHGWGWNLS